MRSIDDGAPAVPAQREAFRRARPMVGARLLAGVLAVTGLALPAAGGAAAQEDPTTTTTTTTTEPTTTTTAPEEPTTTTSTTTTTVPPTTTAPTTVPPTTFPPATEPPTSAPAPTTTTTATTTTSAPAVTPPAVGGDAAPPPGAQPVIPPEILAKINSVRRSGPNSSAKLLEALAPLMAMGMSEQEAVQAGFGRFPVGGRATFTDDWWFARFVPTIHLHEGTDIFAAYGTPARAPADGTLTQSFGTVGGLAAYVTQADGTYYYLAHLSRYEAGQVSGQAVKAGDVVGYVGDSGNARGTSPHVHFEIHPRGGGPVNPKPYLDRWLREALDAVPAVVAAAAPALAQQAATVEAAEQQDMTVAGHSDLGGGGSYGDVAVTGRTALVAAGDPAPVVAPPVSAVVEDSLDTDCHASISVVDLSDPRVPRVTAAIDVTRGRRIEDLDALSVSTPSFTGDLAAAVIGPCVPGDGGTGLAYYDVTNRSEPRLLAEIPHPRRLADAEGERCTAVLRGTCARTSRTVELHQLSDGRLASLSSTASAAGTPAEVYVIDLDDPESPEPLGFVAPGSSGGGDGADDGCAPLARSGRATGDDRDRLAALVDIAGYRLAPEPPPSEAVPLDAGAPFPAVVETGGRRLGVAGEGAWWASAWALRVEPPAPAAGDRAGCRGPISAAGSGEGDEPAQLSAGPTAGELAYVGRGCPSRRDADGNEIPPDPYLADPAGRIVVVDAALVPVQHGLSAVGCSAASRLTRATQAGARGLVLAASFLADGTDVDGEAADADAELPAAPIPAVRLRKPDGDAVRQALCPPSPDGPGTCGPLAAAVASSVVELPGRWGGLRIVDITDDGVPRQVDVYRTRAASVSTPSDPDASYAVEATVSEGTRVYVAWGSDGLQVLDLASGQAAEVGSFIPPQTAAEPGAAPPPAHVVGVDQTEDHIVVTDRATGLWVLDKRPPPGTRGYWLADAAGGVHAFGDAKHHGSAGPGLASPIVAMAPTPSGGGYWLASADGGVFAFGDAPFAGSLAGAGDAPVVAIAATPSGRGYWLADATGGVFAYGDATFLGSLGGSPPAQPVVALMASPTGRGYRLVAADGGVFAFGDAEFLGSIAGSQQSSPVVGAAPSSSGQGYWLVGADGGVFAFGDARFRGSVAGPPLSAPVAGAAPMTGVKGYWLAGRDGAVYALGVPFLGARAADAASPPVVSVAAIPRPPAPPPAEGARPPRQTPFGMPLAQ